MNEVDADAKLVLEGLCYQVAKILTPAHFFELKCELRVEEGGIIIY